jgi:hypothetical protein
MHVYLDEVSTLIYMRMYVLIIKACIYAYQLTYQRNSHTQINQLLPLIHTCLEISS